MAHENHPVSPTFRGVGVHGDAGLGRAAPDSANPPQPEDTVPVGRIWSATLDLSESPPVLDDELAVIETYLGTALDELLSEIA